MNTFTILAVKSDGKIMFCLLQSSLKDQNTVIWFEQLRHIFKVFMRKLDLIRVFLVNTLLLSTLN